MEKNNEPDKDKRNTIKKLAWVAPTLLTISFTESVQAVQSGWVNPSQEDQQQPVN